MSSPYSHPTVAILAQAHWPCTGQHGACQCQQQLPLGVSFLLGRSAVAHKYRFSVKGARSVRVPMFACMVRLMCACVHSGVRVPLVDLLSTYLCMSLLRGRISRRLIRTCRFGKVAGICAWLRLFVCLLMCSCVLGGLLCPFSFVRLVTFTS